MSRVAGGPLQLLQRRKKRCLCIKNDRMMQLQRASGTEQQQIKQQISSNSLWTLEYQQHKVDRSSPITRPAWKLSHS